MDHIELKNILQILGGFTYVLLFVFYLKRTKDVYATFWYYGPISTFLKFNLLEKCLFILSVIFLTVGATYG